MSKIKVLSVRQPWAWLIVSGFKDVENRSWKTNYRGRLYIHAGKSFDWDTMDFPTHLPYVYRQLVIHYFGITDRRIVRHQEEFGAIVGCVELVDCIQNSRSIWAHLGMLHWEVKNPIELAPIPLKGRLGIFEVDREILEGNAND